MELERLALECIPPARRRGCVLDGISAQALVGLYRAHGFAAVKAALMECGGAERPVAMAARRLERAPAVDSQTGRRFMPGTYLES